MTRAQRSFLMAVIFAITALLAAAPTSADSSSPLLAAYYDRQMAVVGGVTYYWEGTRKPKRLGVDNVIEVGVGRETSYALTRDGRLLGFRSDAARRREILTGVATFAAGDTGVLAVTKDGVLFHVKGFGGAKTKIAEDVRTAAVGDSANYYVTTDGRLFVKGLAHRGQYGDGRLESTDEFVETARDVVRITAHTGHAILLKANGDVMGTGGNIYGPVGRHGLGDKAIRWSLIQSGARAIATGSSHTLAILDDHTLVAWGRGYGTEPKAIMKNVEAVAAGAYNTFALKRDGTLWQWGQGGEARRVKLM